MPDRLSPPGCPCKHWVLYAVTEWNHSILTLRQKKEKTVMVVEVSFHTAALLRCSCFGRPRRERGPVVWDWSSRPGSWPVPRRHHPPLSLCLRRAAWSAQGLLVGSSGPSRAGDLQIHHPERGQAGRARPSHWDGVCQAVPRKPVLLPSGRARCSRPRGFKRRLLLQVEEQVSSLSCFSFPPFIWLSGRHGRHAGVWVCI